MELITLFGAVLVALAILSPALVRNDFTRFLFGDWKPKPWRWALANFWADQTGVVAITYLFPTGNNNSTPPTAAQASQVITQTGQVFFADTDAQAVIVHNWGMAASAPFFLFPFIWMLKSLGGASDSSFATNFTFGFTNTNSVTINKINVGTGSGGTYDFWLRKVPFAT